MAFSMYMAALLVSTIKTCTVQILIPRFAGYYSFSEAIMQVVFHPRIMICIRLVNAVQNTKQYVTPLAGPFSKSWRLIVKQANGLCENNLCRGCLLIPAASGLCRNR